MSKFRLHRRLLLLGSGIGIAVYTLIRLPWFKGRPETIDFLGLFHKTSMILLGVNEQSLDKFNSERIYFELTQFPDIKNNLYRLCQEVENLKNTTGSELTSIEFLSTSVQPMAKTVLKIWYTGVISFGSEDSNKRLFYEESLMHRFYEKIRPSPGNCKGSFGDWSKRGDSNHV